MNYQGAQAEDDFSNSQYSNQVKSTYDTFRFRKWLFAYDNNNYPANNDNDDDDGS
ncbi:hypothetical protein [Chryseobacterium populi]|uniref:hypothetical protein n=1 Tax=Chryseobacterium populi TaxID=1144316 RepID=UPI0012E06BF9|nr:hypothetical protein [Chryseobacterium populi]